MNNWIWIALIGYIMILMLTFFLVWLSINTKIDLIKTRQILYIIIQLPYIIIIGVMYGVLLAVIYIARIIINLRK